MKPKTYQFENVTMVLNPGKISPEFRLPQGMTLEQFRDWKRKYRDLINEYCRVYYERVNERKMKSDYKKAYRLTEKQKTEALSSNEKRFMQYFKTKYSNN